MSLMSVAGGAAFKALSQGVGEGLGKFNKKNRQLLELLDPQSKNIFDVLMYPTYFPSIGAGIKAVRNIFSGVIGGVNDVVVAKLHLQNLTVPFFNFEYETVNDIKVVKSINHPEDVSMSFLETDDGVVRRWLQYWSEDIYDKDSDRFMSDQRGANKNAVIIPHMRTGLPSTGWYFLEGLMLKSIGNIELSQGDGDPLKIEATFKLDKMLIRGI